MNKYKKFSILSEWLDQGRILEIDNVKYSISENDDILQMMNEGHGVILPLPHVWKLIEKIDEDKLFLMGAEIAMTNIGIEKSDKRMIKNNI